MKKIAYNLAARHKIHVPAFAARAALLLLASLLLGGLAAANLVRLQEKNRAEKSESGLLASQLEQMNRLSAQRRQAIAAWKNEWQTELNTANRLIERKSFSFISRLDLLEKTSRPGIRFRQLYLVNEPGGQVSLSISAQSLQELFAFYKRLLPFGLAITSETQTQDDYLVNLNFKVSNEKM